MAIDDKYGRIEFPDAPWCTIGADEPVFVFRAQDNLTPAVIQFYRMLCVQTQSPQHHLDLIDRGLRTVKAWQQDHPVKDPNSNTWLKAQDPRDNPQVAADNTSYYTEDHTARKYYNPDNKPQDKPQDKPTEAKLQELEAAVNEAQEESIEDVLAAFDQGEKGVTSPES